MKIKNALEIKDFFKVLDQTKLSQVGVMNIEPGSDSGPEELHEGDQIVYVISGEAEITVDHKLYQIKTGDTFIIPKQTQHHFKNSSKKTFTILTCYPPPEY
jgi:quercetin dioxygenase-like cupin family protein